MADTNLSNMSFQSNLQPIGEEKYRDSEFLKKVRDPFALEYMHRNHFPMTPVQSREHDKASMHCSYAFTGDYPWGTVTGTDGQEHLICKCQNMQCSHFSECNPYFQLDDLTDLIENEVSAFLRYTDENTRSRNRHLPGRKKIDSEDLISAYRKVLQLQPEEENVSVSDENEPEPAETVTAAAVDVSATVEELPAVEEELPEIPAEDSAAEAAPVPAAAVSAPAEQLNGFSWFLHAEYDEIVKASPEKRMLVNAGPGTGKTWALIEKIKALVNNREIDPNSVLVLSFSRAAVEEIEKRLKEEESRDSSFAEWRKIDFSTLDSFASRVIYWVMKNQPEDLPQGYSLVGQGYDARIETARQLLKKDRELLSGNVHVLIDEVQDLVGCRAKFVLNILHLISPECGFTLLGDACQSLYDYQKDIDSSILSSREFYELIFQSFKDKIGYFRFDENHRQSEWLRDLIRPYRDAILTGTAEDRRNIVFKIRQQVMDSMIDLSAPDPAKISHLTEQGSVAVLTRSNGEALKISEYLKSAGIPHRLERPDTEEQMNDWVAAIFTQYSNEKIDRERFLEEVEKVRPDLRGAQPQSCWKALTENMGEKEAVWPKVSDILENLVRRGKNRALFRTGQEEKSLTVSNIHRAKGKEYDIVLVPAYSLDALVKDKKDQINEHKVCYVACTRPKQNLKTASLDKVYVSRDKKTGRCFEGRFIPWKKNQRRLAALEIGLPEDVDIFSLANEKTQAYIRDKMQQDDRIVLKKEISDGKVRYSIRPENDQEMILGYMSERFSDAVGGYCRFLARFPGKYDPKYYPADMDNIAVTKKTTCIVAGEKKMNGVKYFDNFGIWYGFALTGFAHVLSGRH